MPVESAKERLSQNQLTEAELTIAQRYQQSISQLQNLMVVHQQALNDILGLSLEARGLSPMTHEINANGAITPKLKKEVSIESNPNTVQP